MSFSILHIVYKFEVHEVFNIKLYHAQSFISLQPKHYQNLAQAGKGSPPGGGRSFNFQNASI